ncbi:hypothetical protein Hanom_Chr16g01504191 [Helianthus anomalus]
MQSLLTKYKIKITKSKQSENVSRYTSKRISMFLLVTNFSIVHDIKQRESRPTPNIFL